MALFFNIMPNRMLYFDGTKENVYSAMGNICVNTGIVCLGVILEDNNNDKVQR